MDRGWRTYRSEGKVKNETVASLSALPDHVIDWIDAGLKGRQLVPAGEAVTITRSLPHGHVAAVHAMAARLGLPTLLGPAGRARDLAPAVSPSRMALFGLSGSWMEGRCCPLAARGYSRDGKKGKLQIEYGLLTDPEGRPVAVRVLPGNTGDPAAFTEIVKVVRDTFGLEQMVMAGDGPLQLSLFDQQDLAEITSEDFPGERLIACRNPVLAAGRDRTREELLAATEKLLAPVIARVQAGRLAGAGKIGVEAGKVITRYKMRKPPSTGSACCAPRWLDARSFGWSRRVIRLESAQLPVHRWLACTRPAPTPMNAPGRCPSKPASSWTPPPLGRAEGRITMTPEGAPGCDGKTLLNKVLPARVCIPITPSPGHGRHAGFCRSRKVTVAGTPSARSLRCSPAGSRSSWTVTLILPPGCLTTVQAVSWKPGRGLAG
ncbi:MAG: hypothetical protein ACLP7J_06070 [Streptosporangiaceae bacterium]